MPPEKKIAEAKSTCDGLRRLVRKLNIAAVDLDKSGGSTHDLIALLATTQSCVSSLSTQLDSLAGEATAESLIEANQNVTAIHRPNDSKHDTPASGQAADGDNRKNYSALG